jgi:hypothetical protein
VAASQPHMPYQRGQFWIRRFQKQASALCAALAAKITPPPAASFVLRALHLTVVRPRSVRFSGPLEHSHTALVLRGALFPSSFGLKERFPWIPKPKKSPCFATA